MKNGKKFLVTCATLAMVVTPATSASASSWLSWLLPRTTSSNNNQQLIGVERAKSIALSHAGLSASQVSFVKARQDFDDGRIVYDIEFYRGNVEYDYEIDAITGRILEFDRDIENYRIPGVSNNNNNNNNSNNNNNNNSTANAQYIGVERAKSIALSAAGVSASQARGLKVKLDRENGIMVYEVEFKNGRMEYEYDIDAVSGRIVKTDIDYD